MSMTFEQFSKGKPVSVISPEGVVLPSPETDEEESNIFSRIGERFQERGQNVISAYERQLTGEQSPLSTGLQLSGEVAGGALDIVGEGVSTLLRPALETETGKTVARRADVVLGSKLVQDTLAKYLEWKKNNLPAAENLESIMNIGSLITLGVTKPFGVKIPNAKIPITPTEMKGAIKTTISDGMERINARSILRDIERKERIQPGFPETSASLTRGEILHNITPDIKARIQGNPEELDRFFNQARNRNASDTAKSPLALAGDDAAKAFSKIEDTINDTGSEIGKYRVKLGKMRVSPVDVDDVLKAFDDAVAKKGLIVGKNRMLGTAKNRETIFSSNEIKMLQDMRNRLIRLKGDPNIARMIDNRNLFDKNAAFGKSAREISNEVDSVAKATRNAIKTLNERIVGKLEADKIERYSDLIKTLDEFKSLSSKGKNFEFLLKRVLSERDRIPQRVIDDIKQITGIDLMDSAQFSRLAVEILGNNAQKGLFRQEIARAGIDVADMLSGGKLGIFSRIIEGGKDLHSFAKGIDPKIQAQEEMAQFYSKTARGGFPEKDVNLALKMAGLQPKTSVKNAPNMSASQSGAKSDTSAVYTAKANMSPPINDVIDMGGIVSKERNLSMGDLSIEKALTAKTRTPEFDKAVDFAVQQLEKVSSEEVIKGKKLQVDWMKQKERVLKTLKNGEGTLDEQKKALEIASKLLRVKKND